MSKLFLMRAMMYNQLKNIGVITDTTSTKSVGELAGIPIKIAKPGELVENLIAWTES